MKVVDKAISHLAQAQNTLWLPYDITEATIQSALSEIFSHKVDFADLYFQKSNHEVFALDEGIVNTGSFSAEQGVGIRAVSGEKTAFAYTVDLGPKTILEAAKSVREIAAQGQSVSRKLKTKKGFVNTTGLSLYGPQNPITSLTAKEKIDLLHRLESYARKRDKRVQQVQSNLSVYYEEILVARSDGVIAADIRPLVRMNVQVVVESKGRRESGFSGGGGRDGLSIFTDEILESYASKAVDEAIINLESRPAPAGEQVVVLAAGWPGVLLHEAIGHGLEGDFNRKGSSAFSGRIGEQVAAKGVTVVDDGTLLNRRGSLNIDDEGNPSEYTVLIEDGILKNYMQDMTNARLMKMAVTGNGRRESFQHLPMPRMTNTYMLNGQSDPEEILSSVKDGIYAVNFGGGQVDITSGKFVFSASLAYKVENGKIKYPIKGGTLIGNGPDALTKVSMVGNDLALDSGVGVCGKEGQSVPVGVGQPTMRIDGLVMGGTE